MFNSKPRLLTLAALLITATTPWAANAQIDTVPGGYEFPLQSCEYAILCSYEVTEFMVTSCGFPASSFGIENPYWVGWMFEEYVDCKDLPVRLMHVLEEDPEAGGRFFDLFNE